MHKSFHEYNAVSHPASTVAVSIPLRKKSTDYARPAGQLPKEMKCLPPRLLPSIVLVVCMARATSKVRNPYIRTAPLFLNISS